jgi:hypothetical protein
LTAEGFTSEAVPGGKGQFDVVAEGEVVFSKATVNRFPEDGEILDLLRR